MASSPLKKKRPLGTLSANIKVENDGGWDWQGFGNIDGQKALIEGTASYVASTFSGGMRDEYMRAFSSALIGAYVKKGVSELFEHYGGRDFGDEYSLEKPITVDTLSIAMNQSLNDLKGKLQYAFLSDEKKKSMTDAEKARYGMGRETQTFWQKLASGVGGVIDDFASMGSSFAEEFRTIRYDMLNIGDVLTLPFAQRSGLTSAERAKMLDESRKAWEDKSMERWLLTTYYKDEKKWNAFVDEMGLDAKNKDLARDMRKVDEFSEKANIAKASDGKEIFNKLGHEKTIEYINAKARLAYTLGGDYAISDLDKSALFHALWQGDSNGPIFQQMKKLLENDKMLMESLHGVKYWDSKYTFDKNNPESIKEYAKYIAHNSCLLQSVFGAMILTGSEKAPDSFGEFYKEAREKKLIGKLEPERGVQAIFDAFLGKGVLVALDLGGSSTEDRLNNIQNFDINKLGAKYANYDVLGGILNNGRDHFMFYDEKVNLYDTGLPGSSGPRKHTWGIDKWIIAPGESHTIKSNYMLIFNKNSKLY